MRTINLILDQERQNEPVHLQGIMQGNMNIQFKIKLAQSGTLIDIDTMKKPKVIYRWMNTNKAYIFDESSDGYDITVADNTITIPANERMVMGFGQVQMKIVLDDLYTYSCTYSVDKNLDYKATLIDPTSPHKFALEDLSNVSQSDFDKKAKASGLLTTDLADVDLDKLDDKFNDTDSGKQLKQNTQDLGNKANTDMTNVTPATFNSELMRNKAFIDLQNKHPGTTGKTDAEIKALFFANRYEEERAVDLTQPPFDTPTTLLLVYQIKTEGETIKQVLPPHTTNQIIMVEMLFSTGVTNATLEIDVVDGEQIEGYSGAVNHITLTKQGYAGYFLPLQNNAGYEFISSYETADSSIIMSDSRGNVILEAKDILFKEPFYLEHDDDNGVTSVNLDETRLPTGLTFLDGETNQEFVPKKVQSLDKTIRIAELPSNIADLSANVKEIKDGVFATLGRNEDLNTNFKNQRPFFTPSWSKMGNYINEDRDNKGWTVQDGSDDDPSVSGGTGMHIGMYLEFLGHPVASEKGYVEIKVINTKTNDYVKNSNGEFMARRIHYDIGAKLEPELLIDGFMAKGQEDFAFEIDSSFSNQVLTLSPNCAIYIQETDTFMGTGIAELMFAQHVGIKIYSADRYYGTNWMNFAASLTGTKGFGTIPAGDKEMMGNGLFFATTSGVSMDITNGMMVIQNNGNVPPVFEFGKIANPVESLELQLKTIATTLTLASKETDFEYALMKWAGTGDPTLPIVASYSGAVPVFSPGWTLIDKKQMPVQVDGLVHSDSNAFTVPENVGTFALIAYPTANTYPMTVEIHDFEGDITPAFDRYDVSTNFGVYEPRLAQNDYTYISEVTVPPAIAGLRYTLNSTDTKIPFGIITGGDGKLVNDHSWNDGGGDADQEGNGKALVKGTAKRIKYKITGIYCGESVQPRVPSYGSFRMQKIKADGTIEEIPGSEATFDVSKEYLATHVAPSKVFTTELEANDSLQLVGKMDIDDGAYIQHNGSGEPLVHIMVDFLETEDTNQDTIDRIEVENEIKFVNSQGEVFDKILEYNIDTGKFSLIDK